ncbi:hypothetical protein DRO42_04775 [Candidatus Bathyarchaeota archaeon]|nr:MAG: hypothetical protein DRO42_04775 [Candidatus Bathyarchaeota archaeon]
MTIVIDDAGYGDLLFGAVIGAYRPETGEFIYDVIDIKYFQRPRFARKEYLSEARRIALELVDRLGLEEGEQVQLCRGDILDEAAAALEERLGKDRVARVKVEGEAQRLVELAYLNEIRNLGYEPIPDRTERWGKSFFHMLRWLKAHPEMLRWAKTGWPRLKRFRLFKRRRG